MNGKRVESDDDRSSWPYLEMLLFGTFGGGTSAGRSARHRGFTWLAVFAFCAVMVANASLPWAARVMLAVAAPMAWVAFGWSSRRYFLEMDELTRLMHLEATAFAYGAVVVLAIIWHVLGLLDVLGTLPGAGTVATLFAGRARAVVPLFVLFVVVEPIRGLALALLARSRQ